MERKRGSRRTKGSLPDRYYKNNIGLDYSSSDFGCVSTDPNYSSSDFGCVSTDPENTDPDYSNSDFGCVSTDPENTDPGYSSSDFGCSRKPVATFPSSAVGVLEAKLTHTERPTADLVLELVKSIEQEIAELKKTLQDLATGAKDVQSDPDLSRSDFGRSRESVATIPSSVVKDDKAGITALENPTIEDLFEETAKLVNDIKDRIAGLEKEKQDLIKEYEDYVSGLEKEKQDLIKEYEDYVSDLDRKKDMREALSHYKKNNGFENKALMKKAQQRYPTKFPTKSLDLINFVETKFSWASLPHNIDKIWESMTLANNFIIVHISTEDFKKLMVETYRSFPNEFPGGQFRIAMQMVLGYMHQEPRFLRKNSVIERKLHALSVSIHDLSLTKDLREKLVNLIILTRTLFPSHFPHEAFVELLEKAHELFPKEFPPVPLSQTFTGTVAILENMESSVKDEELLMVIKDLLKCLLDVAIQFKPSQTSCGTTLGEQIFRLCEGVARSNRVDFHKKLALEKVKANAREENYKVGDHDVGSAVLWCLKSRAQPARRGMPPRQAGHQARHRAGSWPG